MDRLTVTIYEDDEIEDALARIKFVLNEMGIFMRVQESNQEQTVYVFTAAEKLDDIP